MNEHRLKQIVTIIMSILLSACAGQYRASAGNCDAGSLKADGQWQESDRLRVRKPLYSRIHGEIRPFHGLTFSK